jgi:putative phosphoesterase
MRRFSTIMVSRSRGPSLAAAEKQSQEPGRHLADPAPKRRPSKEIIRAVKVGVLSDTHGLLRPQVLSMLEGCDRLLHAGDVGDVTILDALRRIAPLEVVRGNVDQEGELGRLPHTVSGHLGAVPFGMVHRREDAPGEWKGRVRLIVFGHSHQPELSWSGRCLLLNPGACGHRRFQLPLTLAILRVEGERLVPEIRAVE